MSSIIHKVAIPSFGLVSIKFYDIARSVYSLYETEKEFDRQKRIKHLGLIEKTFDGASHSRYEYLMLQCAMVDLFDNIHKGSSFSLGSIKVNGQEYTGNSILKSWFMLSNFGHTKNTYADERSLLKFAKKLKGFKSIFLCNLDNELEEIANVIINNFDVSKFHFLISLHRLDRNSSLSTEMKQSIRFLFKMLLSSNSCKLNIHKLQQLTDVYGIIRKLSIISIDAHYSHIPFNADIFSFINSLNNSDRVVKLNINSSLNPFVNELYDSIYHDPEVCALQKSYEIESLKIIDVKKKQASQYKEIIRDAIQTGLVTKEIKSYIPYVRFKLPVHRSRINFYDEVRRISILRKHCVGIETYLDHNPITNARSADIFFTEKFTSSSFVTINFNICNMLLKESELQVSNPKMIHNVMFNELKQRAKQNGIPSEKLNNIFKTDTNAHKYILFKVLDKDLIPSYENLFWAILKFIFKDDYRLSEVQEIDHQKFYIKTPHDNFELIKEDLDRHQEGISDKGRKHEVNHLKNTLRNFEGFALIYNSRINIYDFRKKPSESCITDIDSIIIELKNDSLKIRLLETKSCKSKNKRVSTAKKELKTVLSKTIESKCRYRIIEKNLYGASLDVTFQK